MKIQRAAFMAMFLAGVACTTAPVSPEIKRVPDEEPTPASQSSSQTQANPGAAAAPGATGPDASAPEAPATNTPATTKKPVAAISPQPGSPEIYASLRFRPVAGVKGMVVSDDRQASEWGAEILRQGGNAVDAAVATAFALAVTRPHYGSLGGGGFLVYCPKPSWNGPLPCETIDYRERAPLKAHRDLFVKDGKARSDLSQEGALASGTPGVVAGLSLALEKWGTLSRQKILKRPIELARGGVAMSSYTEAAAEEHWTAMNDAAKQILGCPKKGTTLLEACAPGTKFKQADLAKVLEEVSRKGRDGFYRGWVAERIAAGIQKAGGILSVEDMKSYQAVVRPPVVGMFKNWEVVSMGPPSSGGAIVLQLLKYAELAEASGAFEPGAESVPAIHAIAHGMALAFADRAQYFGDPDHVSVPLAQLLAPAYLESRWKDTYRASEAAIPKGPGALQKDSDSTTHFSVIDREGNSVSVTTTINHTFGSAFVPPGTGIFMNNEMDDFSAQPGVPNAFGLVGDESNAIAPGKRPLSSMAPTIVRTAAGRARLVIGGLGGPRIPTAVFQAILNRLQFQMPLPDAVIEPRVHQQWKPADLQVESPGFGAETLRGLEKLGYKIKKVEGANARLYAIEAFANGRVWGVADPRTEGAAVAE